MAKIVKGQGMMDSGAAEMKMKQLEQPEPGPGQVLLRVDVAGLCHSDLHIIDGRQAAGKAGMKLPPMALSHEIGGTVIAAGAGVTSVEVGKAYVLYPWLGCGSCIQCADPLSDEIFCMGSGLLTQGVGGAIPTQDPLAPRGEPSWILSI